MKEKTIDIIPANRKQAIHAKTVDEIACVIQDEATGMDFRVQRMTHLVITIFDPVIPALSAKEA